MTHDVQCVALRQLETSLHLYFEGEDYYSVITLAGAAEEVLGKLAEAAGYQNELSSEIDVTQKIFKARHGEELPEKVVATIANKPRNALKHWKPGDSKMIEFDAKEEATAMLDRAIGNFYVLTESMTQAMTRFYNIHVSDELQIRSSLSSTDY